MRGIDGLTLCGSTYYGIYNGATPGTLAAITPGQTGLSADLPLGLGARHSAAASITVETRAVAISVSQTTGTVRVFKGGDIVLQLHQTARRI